MTRLTWGDPGTRFYETGVDRGVLYVDPANGVAWSGLTGVSESPTGGEARPRYIDGFKFRNSASAEEFEASIEAFSSPPEFGVCDGTSQIQYGLFATQQRRRAFNFSYRTLIGNDTEGSVPNYKIHIVYNALAAPSSRPNATMSETPSPTAFSWAITTMPKSLSGHRPTAHFIIDSRYTPRGLMKVVEDILYGTDIAPARLPMPSELAMMFKTEGPILRRNLVLAPGFRLTSGTSEIRRNLSVNPRYSAPGSPLPNAANWSVTRGVVVPEAHPQGISTCAQISVVDAASAAGHYASLYNIDGLGDSVTARGVGVWVYSPQACEIKVGTGSQPWIPLEDGVWTYVKCTVAFAGQALFYARSLSGTVVNGESVYVVGNIAETNVVVFEFFDGDTPADDGLTFSWLSTPGASASIATGRNPLGWTANSQVKRWVGADNNSLRAFATSIGGLVYQTSVIPIVSGEIFAHRISIATDVPAQTRIADRPYMGSTALSDTTTTIRSTDMTAIELFVTAAQAASNANGDRTLVYLTTPWVKYTVRNSLVEKVSSSQILAGPFFDGDSIDANGYFYSWSGAANNSQSIVNTWHLE